MVERNGALTALSTALVFISLVSIGCKDPKKEEAPAPAVSISNAAAPSAEATAAPVAAAAPAQSGSTESVEATPDGGQRKLRRLTAAGADAGLATTDTAPSPAPTPSPIPDGRRPKMVAAPMGDEQPYGGGAGSAAPVLKKTPMGGEDPWAKPSSPTPVR